MLRFKNNLLVMSFKMNPYSFHYSTGKVSKLIFENKIFFHRAYYKKKFSKLKISIFPIEGGHNFQGLEET